MWAAACGGGDEGARTAGIRVSPTTGLVTTEHGQEATFEVTLNSGDAPTAEVVILVASDDESEGTVDVDRLTFSPDGYDTPQTVTVRGVDDDVADGHTRFTIELDDTQSDDSVWDGLDPADVEILNFDNDGAAISASLTGPGFVSEDGATTTMAVFLSLEPLDDVVVPVGTSDPGEAKTDVDMLVFTPEDFATPKVVTITGVDDPDADGMQSFDFETGIASSDDVTFDGFDAPDQALLNLDNDSPGVVVVAQNAVSTTYESGNPVSQVNLDVRLQTRPKAEVRVSLRSTDTSEGTIAGGGTPMVLTFDENNWDQLQTVAVDAVDDAAQDGPQDYEIEVEVLDSQDTDYNLMLVNNFTVTNIDDDQVGIIATPIAGLTTNESGSQATFSVQLATEPSADVTIALNNGNPAEGTLNSQTLVFTDQNWFVPQVVTITGVDDAIADSNILYFVTAGQITSSDTDYSGATQLFPSISVTNNDNDMVGIAVNPSGVQLNTSESGGSASFSVVLNTEPLQNVVIDVVSTNPGEAQPSVGQLVFTALDWDDPKTVVVNGVDDTPPVADGPIALNIALSVSDAEPAYLALDPEDPQVVNADNDAPGVTVSPLSLHLSETTSQMLPASSVPQCIQIEFPRCDFYGVRLNTQPDGDVVFDITSSNPSVATSSRVNLQFDPQNYATSQKVTVCGVADGTSGDRGAIIQNLAGQGADTTGYVGFDPADVTVTVHDTLDPSCEQPNPKEPAP